MIGEARSSQTPHFTGVCEDFAIFTGMREIPVDYLRDALFATCLVVKI